MFHSLYISTEKKNVLDFLKYLKRYFCLKNCPDLKLVQVFETINQIDFFKISSES